MTSDKKHVQALKAHLACSSLLDRIAKFLISSPRFWLEKSFGSHCFQPIWTYRRSRSTLRRDPESSLACCHSRFLLSESIVTCEVIIAAQIRPNTISHN